MRRLLILVIILVCILGAISAAKRYSPQLLQAGKQGGILSQDTSDQKVKVVTEESVVIDVVKRSGPSVVTIAETSSRLSQSNDPFSFFDFPGGSSAQSNEPQNIGSGFLVTNDGYVVTNKHVVSDAGAKYTVITQTDKKYPVDKIYRDPLNDIAILKINPDQNGEVLKPLEMGDSSKLQVGQLVIAIGTPLGEFNNSVTTGGVS